MHWGANRMALTIELKMKSIGVRQRTGAGFTLIELITVVCILGIVAAIFIPALSNTHSTRLKAAATVLAADIDFCASECIAHPGDARGS